MFAVHELLVHAGREEKSGEADGRSSLRPLLRFCFAPSLHRLLTKHTLHLMLTAATTARGAPTLPARSGGPRRAADRATAVPNKVRVEKRTCLPSSVVGGSPASRLLPARQPRLERADFCTQGTCTPSASPCHARRVNARPTTRFPAPLFLTL